jgi:hypothetical protein
VIRRPDAINAFEFAVLSGLRAVQLSRGCAPRVERSAKIAITAQQEVPSSPGGMNSPNGRVVRAWRR